MPSPLHAQDALHALAIHARHVLLTHLLDLVAGEMHPDNQRRLLTLLLRATSSPILAARPSSPSRASAAISSARTNRPPPVPAPATRPDVTPLANARQPLPTPPRTSGPAHHAPIPTPGDHLLDLAAINLNTPSHAAPIGPHLPCDTPSRTQHLPTPDPLTTRIRSLSSAQSLAARAGAAIHPP